MNNEFFFDALVRIKTTPVSQAAGFAGCIGRVFGQTQPSSSGVTDIIGEAQNDYALNIFFQDIDKQIWFSPELVELIDERPPGKSLFGRTVDDIG